MKSCEMCCQTTFGNDFQQKTACTTFHQNNLVVKSDSEISNLLRFVEESTRDLGGMNFEVPLKFRCRIFFWNQGNTSSHHPKSYPIGSLGRTVYWPTWRVDFMVNVHVGKYTSTMDPMGLSAPKLLSPWKMEVGRRLSYWKVTFQGLC